MNNEAVWILVVDDSLINLHLVEAAFSQRTDVRVVAAKTGEEALEMVRDQQFDLILLDVHMPVMNGCEVTQRLRGSGIDTPIIALTADTTASTRRQCLEAGCTQFLTKPITRDELLSIVRKYVFVVSRNGTG